MKALYARRALRSYRKEGTFYQYPETLVAAPAEAFTVEYYERPAGCLALPAYGRRLTPRPEWWAEAGLELPTPHLHEDGHCRNCGAHFYARDLKVHFCSGDCRAEFKAKQARDRYAKCSGYLPVTPVTISCAYCGNAFTPRRSDAKTCSDKCRVAAHRAERRVG